MKEPFFKSYLMIAVGGLLVLGALPEISNAQNGSCQDQKIMKSTVYQARGDYRRIERLFKQAERKVTVLETRLGRLQYKIERWTSRCEVKVTSLNDRCVVRQSAYELKRDLYQQKAVDLQFRLDNCEVLNDCQKIQSSYDRCIRMVGIYENKITNLNNYCSEKTDKITDYCDRVLIRKGETQTRMETSLSDWQTRFAQYDTLFEEAAQLLQAAEDAYNSCFG